MAVRGWPANPGEDGRDDVVAEGEERGDGAGGVGGDVVAPGPIGFDDELFAAQFA